MAYPCGTTLGHVCLGASSNPNGNKNCANAQAVNQARPKGANGSGLAADDERQDFANAVKKAWPGYKSSRTGNAFAPINDVYKYAVSIQAAAIGLTSNKEKKFALYKALNFKAQSGIADPPKSKSERIWTEIFVPQMCGGSSDGNETKGTKKQRSKPDPLLYAGHLFTGYVNGELAVVMKTGKSDHFAKERRQQARTFGIPMTAFEIRKVTKEAQAKGEVERRNELRRVIREQHKVFHFGENDAVVIASLEHEQATITNYFKAAQDAATKVGL